MKHLSMPAFAALLVGLGAVSTIPAHAGVMTSSQDFVWGTDLAPPASVTPTTPATTVSGRFTIENLDNFRATFSSLQPGTPSPRYPIVNPTLIVDGMDTGPAFTDPNNPNSPPPYIELLQNVPGPAGPIWDVWSIHFHNPWDWTWIGFGAFTDTQSAIDGLLTPGSLFEGTAMLMPADGGATENFVVGVETVPEPLTLLGVGTALGFGGFFKREIAKKQKKSGKKAE